MRFRSLWTALLSANLLACAPYDYDAERNNSSFKPVGYPVYTLDKNGNTIKSRRMERISLQACREYGSNGGNHFGG